METQLVKKGVLNAFNGIISELEIKEIEDLQDILSIQLHKLTDNGERTTLADFKKQLEKNTTNE